MDVRGEIESVISESSTADSSPESGSSNEQASTESVQPTSESAAPATQGTEGEQKPTTETPAPQGTVPDAGPIPLGRHKEILDKQRAETERLRAEYESRLQRVGWAERYNQADIEQRLRLLEFAERDPVAFMRQFETALRQDPRYAGQTPAPADEPPQPDVLLDSGELTYSAKRMQELLDWNRRQALKEAEREYGEIKNQFQGQKAWNDALRRAASTIEDARKNWIGFSDHEADIKAYMSRPENRGVRLDAAYRAVVVPKLRADEAKVRADERARVLAELKQKATVQPAERPSTPVPASASAGRTQHRSMTDVVADVMRELAQ